MTTWVCFPFSPKAVFSWLVIQAAFAPPPPLFGFLQKYLPEFIVYRLIITTYVLPRPYPRFPRDSASSLFIYNCQNYMVFCKPRAISWLEMRARYTYTLYRGVLRLRSHDTSWSKIMHLTWPRGVGNRVILEVDWNHEHRGDIFVSCVKIFILLLETTYKKTVYIHSGLSILAAL